MSADCGRPLDLATLADYWFDDAEGPDRDAIEEHLLCCDACSGRLRGLAALGDAIRQVVREGAVEMVVTPAYLATAARDGLRIREYRVEPGRSVECTVTAQDDLLIGRLAGDFRGVSRLDLVAEQPGHPPRRIPDVPIHPEATELVVVQAMPFVRTLPHATVLMRLVSHEAGGERVVGEYTFNHSPTTR